METRTEPAGRVEGAGPLGPIGEIVEASTATFRAVAAERFEPPPFGAFVRVDTEGRTTYAVVCHVQHASIDPTRRAIPLGRTWDELRREQPQVLELLTTEFDAIVVAFAQDGQVHQFLPPVPPRVHDFVYACLAPEVVALTRDLSFIRTLASWSASARAPATDELVAAAIRAAAEARPPGEVAGGPPPPDSRREFLLRAGREVADLYRQDYDQARAVLRRLGMRVAGDGSPRRLPDRVQVRRESEK